LEDPYRVLHDWTLTKEKLENLKRTVGIEPKNGAWSVSEEQQLEENMKRYQSMNPSVNIFKLLYEQRNKSKSKVFNETHFWETLSFNLCRKLKNINASAMLKFCKRAGYKTGPYMKHELSCLKTLVKKHGANWQLISKLMNRTPANLCISYNQNVKNNINKGPWHKDEKDRFLCIAKRLIQYNQRHGYPLYQINSRIVSDFVLTRCSDNCQKFAKNNKILLQTLLLDNTFTLLLKETMILYLYCSKNQLDTNIEWKELILLFDGKYSENELSKEYNNIITELPNGDLKCSIESEYKNLIQESECLFKRIDFENVLNSMSSKRTIAWLKSKFYLLVNKNISDYVNKTAEEMISILHDQYCSKSSFNNKTSTKRQFTTDSEEQLFPNKSVDSSIDF